MARRIQPVGHHPCATSTLICVRGSHHHLPTVWPSRSVCVPSATATNFRSGSCLATRASIVTIFVIGHCSRCIRSLTSGTLGGEGLIWLAGSALILMSGRSARSLFTSTTSREHALAGLQAPSCPLPKLPAMRIRPRFPPLLTLHDALLKGLTPFIC